MESFDCVYQKWSASSPWWDSVPLGRNNKVIQLYPFEPEQVLIHSFMFLFGLRSLVARWSSRSMYCTQGSVWMTVFSVVLWQQCFSSHCPLQENLKFRKPLKGAQCHFGEYILTRRERSLLTDFLFLNELSSFSWLNKQTNLKEQHSYILCLHVADPATFLTSIRVLRHYFPLRTACLLSNGNNEYFCICVLTSLILCIWQFCVVCVFSKNNSLLL